MVFLIITLLAVVYTIILGVQKKYASNRPKRYLRSIFIAAIPISLISGISEGTWYSHGFDIFWWIFSILSFIITLITSLLLIGLTHINVFKK